MPSERENGPPEASLPGAGRLAEWPQMIDRLRYAPASFWRCVAVCGTALAVLYAVAAQARDNGQWSKADPEVRAWYERQQTTPETRKRINAAWYKFCCDDADTVNAKFEKRGSGWVYQIEGESEWHTVPQDIVQVDVATPHGKPVLFVDATYLHAGPVCFFPGAAGT